MKKKLFAMLMALTMILTLFTGCANTAAPAEPTPESSSVPEPEPEPEPAPTTVEGVIKEASLSKIIVTLPDGTDLALDTTGITDMKVNLGDEVKVEYTGAIGSTVATKVEVTKAAPVSVTVTGVVKEVSASMMLLTLEDESELVLLTKDIEGLEVKVGDKVTAEYTKGDSGAVASTVEVTEPAAPEEAVPAANNNGASSQSTAPATPVSSGDGASSSTPAPKQNSGSSKSSDPNDMGSSLFNWLESAGFTEVEEGSEDDAEGPAESQAGETSGSPEESGDVYEAIRLINAERVKAGLAELTIDDDLMSMTAVRAEEMSERFEHTRPDGSDWKTIFDDFGWSCPNKRGENGSAGDVSASKTVSRWMNSSGHKANILKDNVTKIGVGYYYNSSAKWKHFWTMIVTN